MIVLKEEPKIPEFLSEEVKQKLSWKELDYVILTHTTCKYSIDEICRMLYLTSRSGYYRMRKRIARIIKENYDNSSVVDSRTK